MKTSNGITDTVEMQGELLGRPSALASHFFVHLKTFRNMDARCCFGRNGLGPGRIRESSC
jgi:hypothetical protein